MAEGGSDSDFGRVLRHAQGVDPTALQIDPAEGFLLSRIDGQTPWRVLREMGAMSPEEVDLCLESWLARGILEEDEERSQKDRERRRIARTEQKPNRAAAEEAALPDSVDPNAIDPELDLDEATQHQILEFETTLRQPYHEILGVAPDASAKDIKRAYFKLSKAYHPDRYFRRQIGSYAGRLDRIFKKITEAYELLSDPTTRAEVERSMNAVGPIPGSTPATPGKPQRPLTPIERLRQRMPFKVPESVLAERRQKASDFFHAAKVSEARGQYLEAASSVRLAIAFDPFNEEYKRSFGDVQAKAAEMRAAQLLEDCDQFETGQLKEAMRLFEEVLLYRPHDPEINDKAAGLALKLGDDQAAEEYVRRAIEHSPEVGRYHTTLGKVHLARGDKGHGAHALERALKIDRNDQEAGKLLASLRLRRAPARGGTQ